MKTFIIVSLKVLIPQCCEPSLHIICTHTRLVVCLGFVTYLHHCCVTTAPPSLCCLIVSIHPRQSYLKPQISSPRVPHESLLLRCLFVPLSVVSLFPCYWFEFYLLSSLLLLTCRLVICRSAKLEFCTLPRTQKKKKKKGKEGGSKDNTNLQIE